MRAIIASVLLFLGLTAGASELSIVKPDGSRETIKTTLLAEQFPTDPIQTANPWAPAKANYEGIDLNALLQHYGLNNMPVRLSALDNYSVVLNPGELETYGYPMLAISKDGKALSRRDFGPSWLIIDFDQNPEFDTERARNISVWQLTEISPE